VTPLEIAYCVSAIFDDELTLQPLKKHILKHKLKHKVKAQRINVCSECNLDLLHPSIVMWLTVQNQLQSSGYFFRILFLLCYRREMAFRWSFTVKSVIFFFLIYNSF